MNNLRYILMMCFNIKSNPSFYYNILYVKPVRTIFSLIIHDKSTSCISNREVMMLKITQKGINGIAESILRQVGKILNG